MGERVIYVISCLVLINCLKFAISTCLKFNIKSLAFFLWAVNFVKSYEKTHLNSKVTIDSKLASPRIANKEVPVCWLIIHQAHCMSSHLLLAIVIVSLELWEEFFCENTVGVLFKILLKVEPAIFCKCQRTNDQSSFFQTFETVCLIDIFPSRPKPFARQPIKNFGHNCSILAKLPYSFFDHIFMSYRLEFKAAELKRYNSWSSSMGIACLLVLEENLFVVDHLGL